MNTFDDWEGAPAFPPPVTDPASIIPPLTSDFSDYEAAAAPPPQLLEEFTAPTTEAFLEEPASPAAPGINVDDLGILSPAEAQDAFIGGYTPVAPAAPIIPPSPSAHDPRIQWRKKNQEYLAKLDKEEAAFKKEANESAKKHIAKFTEDLNKSVENKKKANRQAESTPESGVPKVSNGGNHVFKRFVKVPTPTPCTPTHASRALRGKRSYCCLLGMKRIGLKTYHDLRHAYRHAKQTTCQWLLPSQPSESDQVNLNSSRHRG
jgi:hypothetical protein